MRLRARNNPLKIQKKGAELHPRHIIRLLNRISEVADLVPFLTLEYRIQ